MNSLIKILSNSGSSLNKCGGNYILLVNAVNFKLIAKYYNGVRYLRGEGRFSNINKHQILLPIFL